jgi:hypothetical protein
VADGVTTSYSYNWSGYAQTDSDGTYNAVQDTWTVPTVKTTLSGDQYSSDWVGIGGYGEDTLVQAGTEGDNVDGTARYDAWTEILPASEVLLSSPTVHPGDQIKTTVEQTSQNVWLMEVQDLTTGQSGSRTVDYSSSGASAETVHERPEVSGNLSTLSKTTNVIFNPGFVSTSGAGTPSWRPLMSPSTNATVYEMFMLNNKGTAVIAAPSVLTTNDEGFAVAYGSKSPPAPTPPVAVSTTSLPTGTIKVAYSATLSATGGTSPYSWSVISGALPAGLSLSKAGLISGKPKKAGTSDFTVKVTDSESPASTATATFSFTVAT